MADLYKSNKDQVSVFGFRTQYGGGKSTGFALVYDSQEALKKFEPHYRLVRIGAADKIEKASRQQRTSDTPTESTRHIHHADVDVWNVSLTHLIYRQATEEPLQEVPWYRQDQGPQEEQGLSVSIRTIQHGPMNGIGMARWMTRLVAWWFWSPVCSRFAIRSGCGV